MPNGASPETDTEAVRRVRRALVDLGYLLSSGEVDGIYGNGTAHAVSRFKFDRGISPADIMYRTLASSKHRQVALLG